MIGQLEWTPFQDNKTLTFNKNKKTITETLENAEPVKYSWKVNNADHVV